jgi:hypothetical protein
MNLEDKGKLQSLIGEIEGLKSRQPEESRFKDWREKTEKKLEEACGKGADQLQRFKRVRFFDFRRSGRQPNSPLSEAERREYLQGLEEARRTLQRCL